MNGVVENRQSAKLPAGSRWAKESLAIQDKDGKIEPWDSSGGYGKGPKRLYARQKKNY